MIYGITIVLNDCNFSLKNREAQVKERYSYQAFFTNRQVAKETYKRQLMRVKSEKQTSYGKYDLRGLCQLYKANVDNGRIMTNGDVIDKEEI